MSRFIAVFGASVLLGSAIVYGCGDDNIVLSPKPDSGAAAIFNLGSDAGSDAPTTTPGAPLPPLLGALRDRAGRPLINSALNNTFNPDGGRLLAEDSYNEDSDDAGTWSRFVPELSKNLAIYDALDGVCGNTPRAALASLLDDDRLWLDTSQSTCTKYLAVEQNGAGCGGRTLGYDVVDDTYNLAAGDGGATLSDGVSADPTKTGGTLFPYLVAPTQ